MISIMRMQQTDAEAVSCIEAECFSQAWSQQAFLDALQQDSVFLVAKKEEEVVGYCGMYCSFDEGEITNVAVCKKYRDAHVGTALLQELFKKAKEKNLARILLEVRVSNAPAIHLYEKLGFETLCIRKGFYAFPKEDAFVMQKTLE